MVTKQQQLEWLAHKYKTWPEQGATSLGLSVAEVGKFAIVNCHLITRQEWQQERDKMSSKPEVDSSWYERVEFPPIGTVCEMIDDKNTWLECEVISHKDGSCIGWIPSQKAPFYTYDKNGFRPLSTEREKAIDEMKSLCAYPGRWNSTYKSFAEALYAAGYRKVKP